MCDIIDTFNQEMNESILADMIEVDILESAMILFEKDMQDAQDKYEKTWHDIERLYDEGIA